MLAMSMSWAMTSCSKDDVTASEQTQEEKLPEETSDTLQKIAIQQTAEGYAPVVESISAETFFSHFSKGSWHGRGAKQYLVWPDGTVKEFGNMGSPAITYLYGSKDLVYEYAYSIRGQSLLERPFAYDEATNTLTITQTFGNDVVVTTYTLLSISNDMMCCTQPCHFDGLFDDSDQPVLELFIFNHSNVTVEDLRNNFCSTK